MGFLSYTARQSAWCLCFEDADVETQYVNDHSARVRAHDQQAAAVYLAMVASGSALYLIISAFIPAAKAGRVDCCLSLIICSWIGPAVHLLLLLLLPNLVYERHRTKITLALRLFYLWATSINGFGMCGVGPISPTAAGGASQLAATAAVSPALQESPMSAFFWRSGIIGLVWYSGAFPLLFWQHCLVQTGFLVVYCKTLSPLVCSSIQSVNYGPQTIAAVYAAANGLWAQLLAGSGAAGQATRHAAAAAAAAAVVMPAGSASFSSSSSSSQFGSYRSCMHGLTFLQLLLGHALPTLLLYCSEARCRQQWLAAQRRQRRSSTSDSSRTSDSNGLLLDHSSSTMYVSLEQAAAAVVCAETAAQQAASAASRQDPLGKDDEQEDWAAADGCSKADAASCCSRPEHIAKRFPQQLGLAADASSSSSSSRLACDAPTGDGVAAAADTGTDTGAGASCVGANQGFAELLQCLSWSKGKARAVAKSSSNNSSNNSNGTQAPLLLDLPKLDRFDKECQAAVMPPSFKEVFVLCVSLGIAWVGLDYLMCGAPSDLHMMTDV